MKSQIGSVFMGILLSTIQLCLCNRRATVDSTLMNECGSVSVKFISRNRQLSAIVL